MLTGSNQRAVARHPTQFDNWMNTSSKLEEYEVLEVRAFARVEDVSTRSPKRLNALADWQAEHLQQSENWKAMAIFF